MERRMPELAQSLQHRRFRRGRHAAWELVRIAACVTSGKDDPLEMIKVGFASSAGVMYAKVGELHTKVNRYFW